VRPEIAHARLISGIKATPAFLHKGIGKADLIDENIDQHKLTKRTGWSPQRATLSTPITAVWLMEKTQTSSPRCAVRLDRAMDRQFPADERPHLRDSGSKPQLAPTLLKKHIVHPRTMSPSTRANEAETNWSGQRRWLLFLRPTARPQSHRDGLLKAQSTTAKARGSQLDFCHQHGARRNRGSLSLAH